MAKRIYGKDTMQKQLIDNFYYLADRYSGWKVWCDYISLFSISISNAVDSVNRAAREEEYLDITQRYKEEELPRFVEMYSAAIMAMEDNPDQDFLGSLFMQLNLSNSWKGQFFTPYCVCQMMAEVQGDFAKAVEERGYITINDPCCGAGATLIAAAMKAKREGIFYHDHLFFIGQDIDPIAAKMCYIQLSLLGCAGYIIVGNTLTEPCTVPLRDHGNIWYTPFYFKDVWHWRRAFAMLDSFFASPPAVIDTTGWTPSRSYYYYYDTKGGE